MSALRAVFIYEWKRSLTFGRMIWWLIMAGFPCLITALLIWIQSTESAIPLDQRDSIWSMIYYITVPCVCTAMSVLLTAGPAIASELEQRSWVYLATRPHGIFYLLLGKYAVAVTWGFTAALAGLSLAVLLCNAESKMQIWDAMARLSLLSALGYAAVFLFLGALFPRRAMVFCVMYTAVVEVVLGAFPALINRITVQYRLRSLLVQWVPLSDDVKNSPAMEYAIGQGSPMAHTFWLLLLTLIFLVAAIAVARLKEFTAASESDL